MNDIRPCWNCGEQHHIDDMKCCQYDFDHYCSQCDDVLMLIENKDKERVYVHKDTFSSLQEEMPDEKWVRV